MTTVRWAIVLLLACSLLACSSPATAETPDGIEIVEVYPNPVAEGDAGEYVVLSVPQQTNLTDVIIADDEQSARLANGTVSGQFAVTTDPKRVRNLTDRPVYELEGHIALANAGENITVKRDGQVFDRLTYTSAPEGSVGRPESGTVNWKPMGRTNISVRTANGGTVQTFVLPDNDDTVMEVLSSAEDRIYLGGYTFSSRPVADELIRANERGVDVRVLLEGGPVGGISRREARLLDRLIENEVNVSVVGGPYARVDHHHAKYAVIDDRAMIVTENWKPAGIGGHSSRGWGVIVSESATVEALTEQFRADSRWRDAIPWKEFRETVDLSEGGQADGQFSQRYRPAEYESTNISLMIAPDNAEQEILTRLDDAEESIDVIQVGVGGPDQPFVRALKRAANRGVRVRLLLSRAWYAREENQKVADTLERWAEKNDATLSVRLARPGDRFEKIHAKGMIIDGDEVLVGSLNWNNHSARDNREIVVALRGKGPATYFQSVFADDWQASLYRLTVGLGFVVCLAILGAVWFSRRIEFDPTASEMTVVDHVPDTPEIPTGDD